MGTGPARSGDRRLGLADDGRRSGVDLLGATGGDVGDRHSPPRHRSREPPDQLRGALMTVPRRLRIDSRTCLRVALLAALAVAACGRDEPAAPVAPPAAAAPDPSSPESDVNTIAAMTARFAPVELTADVAALPEN